MTVSYRRIPVACYVLPRRAGGAHSSAFPAARCVYVLSLSYAPAAPIILFAYLLFLLFTFIIVNSKTILNEILIYSVSLAWTFSPLVYSFAHS